MSDQPPDEVLRLADERAAARAAGDFGRADALRDEIRGLGWEPSDGRAGTSLRPALPEAPGGAVGYAPPGDMASLLDEPATVAAGLLIVAEEHPEDLARFVNGLASAPPLVSWELTAVGNAPSFDVGAVLGAVDLEVEPIILRTSARLGWADAVNLGLRRSRAEVTVLLDTSLEPTGDFVEALVGAFEDPAVGLAGPWGVSSADGRQFEEAPPGEVDAIEAYCLAVRRAVLRDVGLFDRHFRYYRNADLDFSFAARAAGWRALRMPPLPLQRHDHRGYASLPAEERDRVSRRNFYRFLKHWGDRRDLLLHPGPRTPHHHDEADLASG
jgi:GT2 family glycosyltransferase